jgi:hypothetical protein
MPVYGFQLEVEGNALKSVKSLEGELTTLHTKSQQVHDGMSSHFNKLGEKVKGFGLNLKNLVLGGLGIGGLMGGGMFAKESIDAFDKYEEGIAKLNAVLTSTRHQAGLTIDELKDSAKELSGQTLFTKASIMDAQSMLLTFTSIRGEIFEKTMPAVTNFATRFKMELPEAANMLGKALNDPLKGMTRLQRQGVVFSEQQKETIKHFMATGQVAKAQQVILTELSTEFGGLAHAMTLTDAGKIKMAKKSLDDMKITIGEMLSKGLAGISPLLSKIGDGFKDVFGTKMSDNLRNSRAEMVALFETLKSGNVPLDQKREIMERLNTEYKDYLPGLITEKTSIDDIAKMQEVANQKMIEKIKITAQEEILAKYFKEAAKAQEENLKYQITLGKMKEGGKLTLGEKAEYAAYKLLPQNILAAQAPGAVMDAQTYFATRIKQSQDLANKKQKELENVLSFMPGSAGKMATEGMAATEKSVMDKLKGKEKGLLKGTVTGGEMAANAINTSMLGGASGGLGEAKVIKIDFHKALMEVNVPGGNGRDIVEKAPLAMEELIRITNNLSQSQGSTM